MTEDEIKRLLSAACLCGRGQEIGAYIDELQTRCERAEAAMRGAGTSITNLQFHIDQLCEHCERAEAEILVLTYALWKACGDDENTVKNCIESQRFQG